jgi:hypothetical protein
MSTDFKIAAIGILVSVLNMCSLARRDSRPQGFFDTLAAWWGAR